MASDVYKDFSGQNDSCSPEGCISEGGTDKYGLSFICACVTGFLCIQGGFVNTNLSNVHHTP